MGFKHSSCLRLHFHVFCSLHEGLQLVLPGVAEMLRPLHRLSETMTLLLPLLLMRGRKRELGLTTLSFSLLDSYSSWGSNRPRWVCCPFSRSGQEVTQTPSL